MAKPLVSVISPTFGNPKLLNERCIPSVLAQTYPNVEHVIVVNGPTGSLPECITPTRRVVHLGRDWHRFTPKPSYGVIPIITGTALARGKYIAYNDHDDELLPHHVEKLVNLLEHTDSDFVYSQMAVIRQGEFYDQVIGSPKPGFSEISGQLLLHKAELLNVAQWDPECKSNVATLPAQWQDVATYAADWDLISRWLRAGAKWAHLPEVTVRHHRDDEQELAQARSIQRLNQMAAQTLARH